MLLVAIDLPDVKAPKLVKSVTDRWPDTAVVVLTDGTDPDAELRCVRNGAYDVLHKTPLDAARTMAMFRRVMTRSRNETPSVRALVGECGRHPRLQSYRKPWLSRDWPYSRLQIQGSLFERSLGTLRSRSPL